MSPILRRSSLFLTAVALMGCDLAPAPEGKARDAVDAQAAHAIPLESATDTQAPPVIDPPLDTAHDWYARLNTDEKGSRSMDLSYEAPETDDVPLSFVCAEGSRRVFVSHGAGATGVQAIELSAGGAHGRYPVGKRVYSDLSDGDYLTAEIPWNDPVLRAFPQTGWIALPTPDGDVRLSAVTAASKARIAAFLEFCEG
ncbi:MAG: hypothetical protein EON89_02555 [Brevundimonas sp.]|nr:MAG: hypothetical protein EON89_02555 [Brevundimonas sp.]